MAAEGISVLPAFAGHPGPVRAMAVTPDGDEDITGGGDGTARVWNRRTAQPRPPHAARRRHLLLVFDQDERRTLRLVLPERALRAIPPT